MSPIERGRERARGAYNYAIYTCDDSIRTKGEAVVIPSGYGVEGSRAHVPVYAPHCVTVRVNNTYLREHFLVQCRREGAALADRALVGFSTRLFRAEDVYKRIHVIRQFILSIHVSI